MGITGVINGGSVRYDDKVPRDVREHLVTQAFSEGTEHVKAPHQVGATFPRS